MKLGLANIVTVFALYQLGPLPALCILAARCLLGSLFAGNASALLFSLLGGTLAMLVMLALSRLPGLSVYGVSIGGAAGHNIGQMAVVLIILGNIAVLGCGVDVVYPSSNEKLYDAIRERGALVSEFLPGTRPDRIHFPIRNRVMSGMANGTLVIEAAERSGTSITVSYAHDQGREVFAIPGRIGDVMSVGPNAMIAHGEAKPVFSAEDILSEFSCLHVAAETRPAAKRVAISSLSQPQQSICRLLEQGEMNFDELCETLGLPIGTLNSCLTELQFLGIMKQLPGRWYVLDTCQTVLSEN